MDPEAVKERTHCIRCGECCLSSSPTLQMPDVSLVVEGILPWGDLYTVRVGELVRDNVQERMEITDKEIIKIKEGEGGGCRYYDRGEKSCTLYDQRPLQCRALECWNPAEFMRISARPKADRKDIIRDSALLKLVDEHGRICSYAELDSRVRLIESEGEEAVKKVLQLLKYDYDLRVLASEKLGIDPEKMDFLFGRPLMDTIAMFGLQVKKEPDGTFFLTILDTEA